MDNFLSTSNDANVEYIYTAYITKKDGTRVYAKTYGKKAFRIPITKE